MFNGVIKPSIPISKNVNVTRFGFHPHFQVHHRDGINHHNSEAASMLAKGIIVAASVVFLLVIGIIVVLHV